MRLSLLDRCVYGAGVLCLLGTAATVWIGIWKPRSPRSDDICRTPCARAFGHHLKRIAREERIRAWQAKDLPSRQAAWIAVNAEYILAKTKILDTKIAPAEATRKTIQVWTQRLLRAQSLSRHGARKIPEEGQARLRAYRSEIDCTLQTYSVSVPSAYDPAVPWPIIISMHGHGWFRPYQGHPAPKYRGAFSLSPQGRGATDYRDLGEIDVLDALEDVRRDYTIDPDRVYLRGGSMGGTGSWNLGVHYADRFAGIMPIAGNADNQAWTQRWKWNQAFDGRLDQLRNHIQESHTSRAFARNLLNLPAYVVHGSGDTVVPPEHARLMVAELKRYGCQAQYREFPNVGHGGFNNVLMEDGLAWICAHSRQRHPRHIRWTTATVRHGTCYWMRIDQMLKPLAFASVEAQAEDDTHITIATRNVRALSIDRTAMVLRQDRPLFLTIDEDHVILPPASPRPGPWAELRLDDQRGWDNAEYLQRSQYIKTRGIEGPIQDALLDPFVLVVGTRSEDPLINRLWMEEARCFANEWKRRNGAPCPFVMDTRVGTDLAATRNLICFGGAPHNHVAAKIQEDIPVTPLLADAAKTLDQPPMRPWHAGRSLRRQDLGFMTIYPNPMAPNRTVVIIAGNGPPAIYQAWQRFGNWFNWGVYDSKKYFDYAVYDARSASPETMLLIGFYGTDWKIDSGKQFRGVGDLRNKMAPQQFPPLESAADQTGSIVDLVNLRPAKIDQMRGAVGFGRTFQGQPLPLSLGIRAPTFLEYDLDTAFEKIIAGGILLNSPETGMPQHREAAEKVRFVIKGDNTVLASAVCSWNSPLVQLEAELNGIKRLRLETVPAGGPAWLHTGAAWLAPRLYRP